MDVVLTRIREFNKIFNKQIEVLYYVLFSIILFESFYNTTLFSSANPINWLSYLAYGATALLVPLCILSILDTEDRKIAIIKLLITALALFQQLYLPRFKMSSLELLVVAADKKSLKRVLQIYLFVGVLLMIMSLIGSVSGYLPEFIRSTKRSFGIVYNLDCAAHYLYLLIAAHMLYFKKHKWLLFGITCAITILIWTLIRAKTTMVLMVVFVLFDLLVIIKGKIMVLRTKPIAFGIVWSFVISMIIMFVLTLMYTEHFYEIPFFGKWTTLTWRLELGYRAFHTYPIRLFGQQVYENLNAKYPEYFQIDCAYLRCLIMYGLTHFIFLLSAHTRIQYRLVKKDYYGSAFLLSLIAINAIMEVVLLDVAYNVFLLMLFINIDIPHIEELE